MFLRIQVSRTATEAGTACCRRLDAVTPVSDQLLRDVVEEALRQLHGYIGGALQTQILSSQDSSATIKVDRRSAYMPDRDLVAAHA